MSKRGLSWLRHFAIFSSMLCENKRDLNRRTAKMLWDSGFAGSGRLVLGYSLRAFSDVISV